METLALKQEINLQEVLSLIPRYLDSFDKKTLSEHSGDIWKKVLAEAGYNADSDKVIDILYEIIQTERYKQALKEAQGLKTKLYKNIETKDDRKAKVSDGKHGSDTGLPHPAMDVTDPRFLRENGDFMQNY